MKLRLRILTDAERSKITEPTLLAAMPQTGERVQFVAAVLEQQVENNGVLVYEAIPLSLPNLGGSPILRVV